MASPVVVEAIESITATAGTSHVVTHPTVVAGQLWLLLLDKGSTSASVNAHADWTELLDEAVANGLYIAYRWTTGAEGASTTLVTSASTRSAQMVYRITGAENPATTAPQIGTTSTGTSATPDPPASATPPSSKDYLFITFFGKAGEEADDDTWANTPPTNYTPSPPRQKACGIAGTSLGGMIASAERALTTGAAENPGTFGVDVSTAWRAQTITVHPAASVTHATSGALTGPGSTVAGTASSATTRAATGVLVGPGTTVAGTAARTRVHATSGVLAGPGATVVGSASRTGAPVTHATSGVLAGSGAVIVGTAARFRAHAASGVLSGVGATVAGSASRTGAPVTHTTSGVLSGAGAVVVGSAARTRVHATSGALMGPGATVTGVAARRGVVAFASRIAGGRLRA